MTWTKTAAARRQDSQRYGPAWRKARAAQLARQPDCEIRYDEICLGRADQVDHVLSAANDPDHRWLRSACGPCHRKHTAATQDGGFRKPCRPQTEPDPQPATLW
jgi:5-methylcytosine-specific restriction endonuclease McrA